MRNIEFCSLRQFARHFFSVLIIFLILALIRYPFFLNSDYFFTSDEGMLASTILNLLKGGPIVFYFDFGRTFGLTFGLVSAPFMWVFGVTTMAWNLPGVLYYSLYLWTTYLIAKILIPRTAYLVLLLMFFTPVYVTTMTAHNWPHILVAFMGNLMFLLFIKVKLSARNNGLLIFFLLFTMGLAIYTYTYSLIYILTIGILYALTHPTWSELREKISFRILINLFKNKKTTKDIICRLLDILIFVIFIAVVFSYIVGGFGLDIGGISIFQINKFHKAAIQLLVVICLRILIDPKGSMSFLRNTRSYFATSFQLDEKHLVAVGGVGFLLGLSPRIASILIGETSRGGQGHDVDFSPIKLLAHIQDLLTLKGPQLLGFDKPLQDLISNPIDIYWIILCILFIPLAAIFFFSAFSFISQNRIPLKNILTLRGMHFKAVHIILLAPILVCTANIIVQNGPMPRYLFPLFGIFTLWVVIWVDKIREKAKWFPHLVLAIWVSYFSFTNHRAYQEEGLIDGITPVSLERHSLHDLIGFLETEKISTAYSDYGISGIGTFLSGGKINISEYSDNPVARTQKERSMKNPQFAIITQGNSTTIYNKYLRENEIEFNHVTIKEYEIFWDFKGDAAEINHLRSLIRG